MLKLSISYIFLKPNVVNDDNIGSGNTKYNNKKKKKKKKKMDIILLEEEGERKSETEKKKTSCGEVGRNWDLFDYAAAALRFCAHARWRIS